MTRMEYDQNGRQPKRKMEDDQNGRLPKLKATKTKMEDEQKIT